MVPPGRLSDSAESTGHDGSSSRAAADPASHQIFQLLAQTAPTGLVLINPDGTSELRNFEAARILGAASGRLQPALFLAAQRSAQTSAVETVSIGVRGARRDIEVQVVAVPWDRPVQVSWLTDVTPARATQSRLSAIAQASAAVADVGDLAATLDAVAQEIVRSDEIAAVQIITLDQTRSRLRLLGTAGFTDTTNFAALLRQCQVLGADLKMLTSAATSQVVLVPHRKPQIMSDPAWRPLHAIMDQPDWDSFASIPLRVNDRTVGVLNTFYAPDTQTPSREALAFLTAMAEQAALAVDRAELVGAAELQGRREERHRVAAELHDSVAQHVFSLNMTADALRLGLDGGRATDAEWLRQQAKQLADSSQQALADLRVLIFELRPTPLADKGLITAVSELVDTIEARSGLSAIFRTDVDFVALPTGMEDDVFRIVQEALHNVVKHAEATTVTVDIAIAGAGGGQLVIDVVDDGHGFKEPAQASSSLGMVSMRERAQRWSGSVVLRTRAGAGSQMRVTLPMPIVPLPRTRSAGRDR